jgi:hypothetical protein
MARQLVDAVRSWLPMLGYLAFMFAGLGALAAFNVSGAPILGFLVCLLVVGAIAAHDRGPREAPQSSDDDTGSPP